ncbi:MAG: PilZ domain-containing protein [Gammaproteobacteria bacterium]
MTAHRSGFLRLDLSERDQLYMAWMSFVQGGGLFVPTTDVYNLGEEVFVRVDMPDAVSKGVAGKVIWITPRGALKPREQGIGIQISGQDRGALERQVETLLAGTLASTRPTQTL